MAVYAYDMVQRFSIEMGKKGWYEITNLSAGDCQYAPHRGGYLHTYDSIVAVMASVCDALNHWASAKLLKKVSWRLA